MKRICSLFLIAALSISVLCMGAGAMVLPEDVGMKVVHGTWNYDPENCVGLRADQEPPIPTPEDLGITVVHGTWNYDPEKCLSAEAVTRAITPPTTYAPDSYYDTWHQWTAVNYTYTSYLFNRPYTYGMDVLGPSDKTYCVEFYNPDDSYIGEVTSESSSFGQVVLTYFNANVPFYAIIRNTSGTPITVSDNAQYLVGPVTLGE